jgi:hypothetical protein
MPIPYSLFRASGYFGQQIISLVIEAVNIRHFKFDFHRLKMADSLLLEEVTSPRKRESLWIENPVQNSIPR